MTKVLYYKSKQRCITNVLYYKSKQKCINKVLYYKSKQTKVLYYKSKQRCYEQSIVLQKLTNYCITKVNKDVRTKVLCFKK